MAPSHSRCVGSKSVGVGLLAAGAVVSTSFVTPKQIPRATFDATLPTAGSRPSLSDAPQFSTCASAVACASVAYAALAASRIAPRRGKIAAAVATIDEGEAPAPPFAPSQQMGAMHPLGFFDPLGFTKVGDEQGFRNLRAAELKHGRVAMMASVGAVGQHFIKFPFAEQVHGTFGATDSPAGVVAVFVLLIACGFLELAWRESPEKEPGNFGDPFGIKMYTEEMREKEISNGRMAMISMLGIFAAELATGKDAVEQFGLFALASTRSGRSAGASRFAGATVFGRKGVQGNRIAAAVATIDEAEAPAPPFAPSQQMGAMQPLGFFDPLGFTKVGDEQGFRNLRAAELKHGRVAMMASVGAVGQHFIKFPFAEQVHGTFGATDSPAGVVAVFVLFIACGLLELAWRESPEKEPGNFGDPFGIKMYTEEMREKEISNSRMAMISMLGIFAAELATGKDAIEQFGL